WLPGQERRGGLGLGTTGFRQRAAVVVLPGLRRQRMGVAQQDQIAKTAHGRTPPMGAMRTLVRFHVPCKGAGSVIEVLMRPLVAPSHRSSALPAACLRVFQSG